jgi:hypothetical protein
MFKRVRVGVSRVRSLLIKTMLIIVEISMADSMDSTENEISAATQLQCSMVFLLSLSFGISIGAKNCSEKQETNDEKRGQ